MPENPNPNDPVFHGGGTRPNNRFRTLCRLAAIEPKRNIESGEEQVWVLKDLRKTGATHYDQHIPESSVEIPGHSAAGGKYRHDAHRAHGTSIPMQINIDCVLDAGNYGLCYFTSCHWHKVKRGLCRSISRWAIANDILPKPQTAHEIRFISDYLEIYSIRS